MFESNLVTIGFTCSYDNEFEPHQRHCVVSLSKNINPSLVLVQPRMTHPFITERLSMGHKESNQTNKQYDYEAMVLTGPL